MNELTIISYATPVPKPRMTRSDKWKQRPCVMRYRAFKDELLLDATKQGFSPDLDVYAIEAVVHIPMPQSWTKKKRGAHLWAPHRQKPDADNILKGVCDALLKDDSGIWFAKVSKFWNDDAMVILKVRYYGEKV